MTTIHAYTADQRLQDAPHTDLRRARAAAINLVPASTGAAKAIGLVIPELKGKLHGFAVRAPVPTGSVVDLTVARRARDDRRGDQRGVRARRPTRAPSPGILQYTDDPIVSSDIVKSPYSSIFDSGLTAVLDGTLVKVVAWYDNEWGYSNRVRRARREGAGACARLTTWTSTASASSSGWTSTSRWTRTARITDDARIRAALPTLRELRERGARLAAGRPPRAPEGPRAGAVAAARGRAAERAARGGRRAGGGPRRRPRRRRRDARERPLRAGGDQERPRAGASATRRSPTSTSTTPSAPRTARTPPRRRSRGCCPARRAGCSSARSTTLRGILDDPKRPLVAVVGGAKVTDKIGVLDAFLERADTILIGGAMCFPFFKAQGHEVGASLCEEEGVEPARARSAGAEQIELPGGPRRRPRVRGRHRAPRARRRRRARTAGWASTSARTPPSATPT